MSDETVKLLEDRVMDAVARIRQLRAERDGRAAECEALRSRITAMEEREAATATVERSPDLERIRTALRDAIRELRGDDETNDGPD
jgi:hypothetical protein